MRWPDPATVAELVRTVAREELGPRFRALPSGHIFSKATAADPDDIVTEADLAVERRLTTALRALLPGAAVVGEEAATADPTLCEALASGRTAWVLDPLDGTRNFAAGVPAFGTMLALVDQGRTAMSWIYLPPEDALFVAVAGAGATLNGQRLSREDQPLGPRPRGTLYTRFMPDELRTRTEACAAAFADLVPSPGCAAHEYTRLARGEKDFVVYHRLHPWDHAPGALLLTESGGVAQHPDGTPYRSDDRMAPTLATRATENAEGSWRTLAARLWP